MGAWVLVGALCIVAALVTVAALFSGGEARRPAVESPDWLLPTPVEMRAGRFPLTWRGYDPAHVDVYLDAIAGAYEALYVAARPEAIAQARERLVLRRAPVSVQPPPVSDREHAEGTRTGDGVRATDEGTSDEGTTDEDDHGSGARGSWEVS